MLRKIIPHITIVLCNMYVVFYLIDQVNPAMEFITNGITKFLLLVMCILSTINAALMIHGQRHLHTNRRRRYNPDNSNPHRRQNMHRY